jgi:Leucine-rich repeat (LRR) protein
MRGTITRTKVVASLLALVGLLVFSRLAMAEDPVYFADVNLKAAVETELGISDPTQNDMLSLTILGAVANGIVSLVGIEYATNLTELYLYDNQISDISALAGLTNLKELYLYNNQISDISALAELKNLIALSLTENPLNVEAYSIYIPLIEDNNPGINLIYDPNPCSCLIVNILDDDDPRIETIRRFRDEVLSNNAVGRKLIEVYYNNEERMMGILENHPSTKKVAKKVLEALIPAMELLIEVNK